MTCTDGRAIKEACEETSVFLCDGWQTLTQRAPAAKIMKVWITESWQNVEKQVGMIVYYIGQCIIRPINFLLIRC